ncbi:hypothetical protein [Coriobacterium glomerans]|uniref:hypothetical protein n=1 Tax=Coriobacterium glomerans TaxID=33871 RepID=UPI00155A43F2|nr:hypothetical protein [Coriobacterium glomerans]
MLIALDKGSYFEIGDIVDIIDQVKRQVMLPTFDESTLVVLDEIIEGNAIEYALLDYIRESDDIAAMSPIFKRSRESTG